MTNKVCGFTQGVRKCVLEHGHDGKHTTAPVHHCHWPDCKREVPPKMWGCITHWRKLPKHLRDKIWATYRPGQEITKTPSRGYVIVAQQVQEWIKENNNDK